MRADRRFDDLTLPIVTQAAAAERVNHFETPEAGQSDKGVKSLETKTFPKSSIRTVLNEIRGLRAFTGRSWTPKGLFQSGFSLVPIAERSDFS